MTKAIVVTGGAGFIGSHVAKALLDAGRTVIVLDDLSTGKEAQVDPRALFVHGSICNQADLDRAFSAMPVEAVFHFAGKLLVEESVKDPLTYYHTNVTGGLMLLRAMQRYDVRQIIFSSSAAVYGNPAEQPVRESTPTVPVNPYGESKLFFEHILRDVSRSSSLRFVVLRYFNVIDQGATHLLNVIAETAVGKRPHMQLFGTDYATPDGTAIRDYIDIADVTEAHLLAYQHLLSGGRSETFNIGTGVGYSVSEMIQIAQRVTGAQMKIVSANRRVGDPERLVASYDHIHAVLGWEPKVPIEHSLRTLVQWITNGR